MSFTIELTGEDLTLDDLVRAARDPAARVRCGEQALARVERCAAQIAAIARRYRDAYARWREAEEGAEPDFDYGITTGFGEFKDKPVPSEDLEELQRNILLSHSTGVGINDNPDDLANYFSAEIVRATLVIRLNAFLRGHSGVRRELLETVVAMIHRGVVPLVPIRGSLGSSGDLCPLAHLFAVLLGEGRFYVVESAEDLAHPERLTLRPAGELFEHLGTEPVLPSYKEGLALTNGATFSAAMLALAVCDAEILANVADVTAAMGLEAVCGCARALDPKVHRARGHRGQRDSAGNQRRLLAGSRLLDAAGAVQDAYSLRCSPQVHGASRDAVAYAKMVVRREINAATDNPLFFPGEDPDQPVGSFDLEFSANWPAGYSGQRKASYSAGNFHGQPIGMAADFLAIAVAELADISERRTQMLLDSNHNRGLPANLVTRRGVNSGYMIAQYTAASLVSENKVLAHPASVDSIPTSANVEDHVAMATCAARKLGDVVGNARSVLAIEALSAVQALDWRLFLGAESAASGLGASQEPRVLRPGAAPTAAEFFRRVEAEDRQFRDHLDAEPAASRAAALGAGTRCAYLAVRRDVAPLTGDRPLSGEIRTVRLLIGYSAETQGSPLLRAVEKQAPEALAGVAALA